MKGMASCIFTVLGPKAEAAGSENQYFSGEWGQHLNEGVDI